MPGLPILRNMPPSAGLDEGELRTENFIYERLGCRTKMSAGKLVESVVDGFRVILRGHFGQCDLGG